MTLEEARTEFEKSFSTVMVGEPTARPWRGGEPYVEIKTALKHRVEDAVETWLKLAKAYRRKRKGMNILVWRIEPEIEDMGFIKPPSVIVYSRMLITAQLPT